LLVVVLLGEGGGAGDGSKFKPHHHFSAGLSGTFPAENCADGLLSGKMRESGTSTPRKDEWVKNSNLQRSMQDSIGQTAESLWLK
jgi:hypothetical protein